jgi:hypothetical protein
MASKPCSDIQSSPASPRSSALVVLFFVRAWLRGRSGPQAAAQQVFEHGGGDKKALAAVLGEADADQRAGPGAISRIGFEFGPGRKAVVAGFALRGFVEEPGPC